MNWRRAWTSLGSALTDPERPVELTILVKWRNRAVRIQLSLDGQNRIPHPTEEGRAVSESEFFHFQLREKGIEDWR